MTEHTNLLDAVLQDTTSDPGDAPPQPKAKRGKPKGKRATPVPDYVSLSTVSSSSSPFPLKDGSADSQLADSSGLEDHMEDHMEGEGADADVSDDFAIPDWLAAKYNTTAKVMPTPVASPMDPTSTPTPAPGTRVPTRMVASAFKPMRRKPTQKLVPETVDQASDAAMPGQMPELEIAQQDLMASSASDGSADVAAEAAADMKAASASDSQVTDAELDEAAARLSPQAAAAMDTLLSSETNPSPDPYSQGQSSDTSLESGDLSPAEVDRDAQLSPEADAVIDACVAAVAPESEQVAQDMPSTSTAAEDDTHPLTDAEVSTQSFAGIALCPFACVCSSAELHC